MEKEGEGKRRESGTSNATPPPSAPLSLQMDQRRDRQSPTLRGKGHDSYLRKDYFFGVVDRRTLESKETAVTR